MRSMKAAALCAALTLTITACGDAVPTSAPNGPDGTPAASLEAGLSAAPVTPAPTPTATPQPTPAVDAALAGVLASADLNAEIAVTATTTIGKAKSTTAGTLEVDGLATHLRRTDTAGRTKTVTETISANGTRYVKTKGVWVNAGATDGSELVALLRGVSSLRTVGVENVDGRQLTHLQATGIPAVPSELALAKDATEVSSTLDAWVTADGSPVTMTITSTWTQEADGTPVEGTRTTELTWSEPEAAVEVVAPPETWAFFTSKRYRYRMAHPDTWEVTPGTRSTSDTFTGDTEYAYASSARQTRVTLSYLTSRMRTELRRLTGYSGIRVTSNRKARLDGVAARRIEFRGRYQGQAVYGQAVYAVKGARWYFVGLDSLAKPDEALRGTFTRMLRTFDFR